MRKAFAFAVLPVGLVASLAALWSQQTPVQPPMMLPTVGQIFRQEAGLDSLLDANAKIEVLASGFEWSEGPVWVKDGGYLLFSDIPRNVVMRWKEGEGVKEYLRPAGYTGVADYGREPGSNGLTLDPQGRLVLCEHGDRRVARLEKNGGKRTLADNYQGKRLNSPNDLVYHSNGDLYFTDPPYGLPQNVQDSRKELDFQGVYRLSKDGQLTLLTKELARPNGLAFSPDEKTLYVAQSDPEKAIWMAYPVQNDGTLGTGRVFADATSMVGKEQGLPDGLKVDRNGNLFATGPGGVHIYNPAGKLLGRIGTGQKTANCAWGEDGSVLYITADKYLCRIRTKTKGAGW